MNGLAIEFHNCDLHSDKIKNFINNFELQLVHIHVNNWALVNSDNSPRVIELIFSTKDFNKKITNFQKKFPISMDVPNNPLYEDLSIEFND